MAWYTFAFLYGTGTYMLLQGLIQDKWPPTIVGVVMMVASLPTVLF